MRRHELDWMGKGAQGWHCSPCCLESSGLAISTQCTLLGSLLPLGQLSTSVAADQVSQLHVLHFKMMSPSLTPASMLMPRT